MVELWRKIVNDNILHDITSLNICINIFKDQFLTDNSMKSLWGASFQLLFYSIYWIKSFSCIKELILLKRSEIILRLIPDPASCEALSVVSPLYLRQKISFVQSANVYCFTENVILENETSPLCGSFITSYEGRTINPLPPCFKRYTFRRYTWEASTSSVLSVADRKPL